MIREAIEKVVRRIDLAEDEMRAVFDEIMSGRATNAQIGAFLVGLRMKGETVLEITGAAKVMREKSTHINAGKVEAIVDTCGTGGSSTNTFNISTTVAFVVAGCGLRVAKHGNRSATGACGSADVLEALGVRVDVGPDLVQRCLLEIGIGFLYAPFFSTAMKYAIEPRREIGIRTIFNILGPLSNPANATSQLIGVCDAKLTIVMAEVLKKLGTKRAFIVYGTDSLDEITITSKTRVTELNNGRIRTYYVTPERFGLKRARLEDIEGGDVKTNSEIVLSVLKGERGSCRDIVLMNAAAALVSGFKAKDFKAGVKLAAESIDSGRALDKLLKLIEISAK